MSKKKLLLTTLLAAVAALAAHTASARPRAPRGGCRAPAPRHFRAPRPPRHHYPRYHYPRRHYLYDFELYVSRPRTKTVIVNSVPATTTYVVQPDTTTYVTAPATATTATYTTASTAAYTAPAQATAPTQATAPVAVVQPVAEQETTTAQATQPADIKLQPGETKIIQPDGQVIVTRNRVIIDQIMNEEKENAAVNTRQ